MGVKLYFPLSVVLKRSRGFVKNSLSVHRELRVFGSPDVARLSSFQFQEILKACVMEGNNSVTENDVLAAETQHLSAKSYIHHGPKRQRDNSS